VRRALRSPTPSRGVLRCRLDVLTISRAAYEKHHSQYLNTQKTAQTHEKTPSSTRNPARVLRVLRERSKHTSPSLHASAARPAPQLTHSRYCSTPHGSPQALILVIVNLNVRKNKTNHQSIVSLARASHVATQSSPNSITSHHSPGLPPTAPSRAYVSFSFIALGPSRTIARRAHTSPIYPSTFNDCQSRKFPPSHRSRVVSSLHRARRRHTRTSPINAHTHYTHARAQPSSVLVVVVVRAGMSSPRANDREAEATFFGSPDVISPIRTPEHGVSGYTRFGIYVLGDLCAYVYRVMWYVSSVNGGMCV